MEELEKTANEPVDAVFVIGTGSGNDNEELKYALRNIAKNCPFIRDVYISGECPEWVDTSKVKHLAWPDRFKHAKDANIIDKLRHACEQPGIAKKILFCSDDQFVTRQCTWDDFEPRWLRRYDPSDEWYEARNRLWHTRLHKTLDRDRRRRKSLGLNQKDVYYYQPHIWMQIDRDKFIEYAKWSDYEHRDDTIIASGYFNFIDAGGKSNFDHVFISPEQKWPVAETHVAYSDSSYAAAMTYLRAEFPDISIYERDMIGDKADSPAPKAEQIEVSVSEDEIKSFKEAISSQPAWIMLQQSVRLADKMKSENYDGWEKVWGDIIYRWNVTTQKGRLIVPVTKPPSSEALNIIAEFKKTRDVKEDKPEENGAHGHKCTKCEERRRKAQEEAREKEKAAAAEAKASANKGCADCASDHLAVAIAYLNSNAGRPDAIEVALARGEVRVAAQHLQELEYAEEYSKCISALDSYYSENSDFNVDTLKAILKNVINRS